MNVSPFCRSRPTLSQSLNPHCTESCSLGVQQKSHSLSCSLAQGLCEFLVGNARGRACWHRAGAVSPGERSWGENSTVPGAAKGADSGPGWEGKDREWLSTWALCRRLQLMQVNRPLAKLLNHCEWCKTRSSRFISQKQVTQPPRDAPGGAGNLRHGALAAFSARWPHPITLSPSLEGACTGAVCCGNPRERLEESKGKSYLC